MKNKIYEITYANNLSAITPEQFKGFCVGWTNPLSASEIYQILSNSYKIALASYKGNIVGFAHAISDKVKFAFIPMLEVLPEYQNMGIGKKLMSNLFEQLQDIDNIDLICDKELQPYYQQLGMIKYTGMIIRK